MHEQGKLDARQRLAALFDAGSFLELGTLVGNKADLPGDSFVCGVGQIDGRPVLAGARGYGSHHHRPLMAPDGAELVGLPPGLPPRGARALVGVGLGRIGALRDRHYRWPSRGEGTPKPRRGSEYDACQRVPARADGFANEAELVNWFERIHGLPLRG